VTKLIGFPILQLNIQQNFNIGNLIETDKNSGNCLKFGNIYGNSQSDEK